MPCASPNSDPAAASELSKKLDSWARRPLGTGRSTGLRLGGGGRRGPEGEAGPEVGAPARLLHPLPAWPIAALLHWSAGFSPFYRWGTEAP